jgi:Na+/H+-dicarboxylate symporter
VVVIYATLPIFHLPVAGIGLILGIDHLMDMGRTATNVVGNSAAAVVVSRWERLDGAMNRDRTGNRIAPPHRNSLAVPKA